MTTEQAANLTWVSPSVERTQLLGRMIGKVCEGGDVIALVGSLGAGKTQFVRGLAAGLGADPAGVSSPTFVLMSEYRGRMPIVHMDAYRMQGLSDLETVGWTEQLFEGAVTAVEWADRIEDELPADHLRIEFDHTDEGRRTLTFFAAGRWADRVAKLRQIIGELTETRPCPACGATVSEADASFPFCSSRCRMAELNKWFNEDYRISRPLKAEDDELDV